MFNLLRIFSVFEKRYNDGVRNLPSALSEMYARGKQVSGGAVVVSSMVTAIAVHNTFFFITFHLLNLYLPYLATQTYHRR